MEPKNIYVKLRDTGGSFHLHEQNVSFGGASNKPIQVVRTLKIDSAIRNRVLVEVSEEEYLEATKEATVVDTPVATLAKPTKEEVAKVIEAGVHEDMLKLAKSIDPTVKANTSKKLLTELLVAYSNSLTATEIVA